MKDMARTIDDLGIETSTRYAQDQEIYDVTFKETHVSKQAQITTTIPSYTSELDLLFDLEKRRVFWAIFQAPPNYSTYRRSCFTQQLIPDLGSPDLQELRLKRIESIKEEREQEKRKKEKKTLKNLLHHIDVLNQMLIDINSRRTQYQKG